MISAVTVPAGSDHEQLEPPSRKQEDARGLNVPQRSDNGGQRTQHHIIYTRFLPQPVSVKPDQLLACVRRALNKQ